MKIDFSVAKEEGGSVTFKGEINNDQWNYIMQRGFLSLFLAGAMTPGIVVIHDMGEEEDAPKTNHLIDMTKVN